MAKHLSVGTIIEKNRIASEETFLILIDAYIKDEQGNDVITLSFVKNSENVIFGKDSSNQPITYQAANFELDIDVQNNTEPSITLTAQDQTRTLMPYIEAYGGLAGNEIRMTVVNSAALDSPPEMQETFKIMSASVSEYVVTFNLGVESAVSKRFPNFRQFKDRCYKQYKSVRCGYAGPLGTCDFSFGGSNGCLAHNNGKNFGGFEGLNGQG